MTDTPTSASGPPPAAGRRHLKGQSIPKRLLAKTPVKFLLVFLPMAAAILGVFALIYRLEVQNEINLMMAGQSATVAAEKVRIEQMLRDGMADVVIQAQNSALVEMPLRPDPALLRYVAMDLGTLLTVTKLYSQARFLNWMGQEVVRVDYRDQKAVVAEDDKLQDKSDRYYFQKSHGAGQGAGLPVPIGPEHGKRQVGAPRSFPPCAWLLPWWTAPAAKEAFLSSTTGAMPYSGKSGKGLPARGGPCWPTGTAGG